MNNAWLGGIKVRFNLLGPLEIVADNGRAATLSTPKVCQVLALLLIRPNEIVSVGALVEELWADHPPRSAVTTLQTYVYHARRIFAQQELVRPDRELLVTRPPGYLVDVTEDEVDAAVFIRLTRRGRTLLDDGRLEEASRVLREALDLWRGAALANVSAGTVLRGQITHLEELKIRAIELRMEAEQRLGRHRELIPELRALVCAYPLNEWFHAQLITALNRSGRRAEALQAYHDLRRILDEELGVLPTPEVQQLQLELLNIGHLPLPADRDRAGVELSSSPS
ncbi:DNA-binding transcriptional activator of the SARP family [Micromonospora sediminicola]|uniref:DNA-binding transcriptional activator of the SARP family n=1 Tax=Micromonospora sediminicola TaxID=946078 RepID=A0A1A9BAD5_9ACTN|nr:DNA-binding transcriptional activator of the SARP family [Micromonospora sediminicola]